MITAFDVYLVMVLDDVNFTVGWLCLVSALGSAVCLFTAFIFTTEEYSSCREKQLEMASKAIGQSKKYLTVAALMGVVWTLIPDSKTLAAMYILPAMTSDAVIEPVSAEARELYTLAKKALNKIADEPAKVEQEAAK